MDDRKLAEIMQKVELEFPGYATAIRRIWDLISDAQSPLDVVAASIVRERVSISKTEMVRELRERTGNSPLRDAKHAVEDALLQLLYQEAASLEQVIRSRVDIPTQGEEKYKVILPSRAVFVNVSGQAKFTLETARMYARWVHGTVRGTTPDHSDS